MNSEPIKPKEHVEKLRLSSLYYYFSMFGPIIKVMFVTITSYIVVFLNDKNNYSFILHILLFLYAIGCILNSLKYYYTSVNCNHNSAPFLRVTQYANILYAAIIFSFLLYGQFAKK